MCVECIRPAFILATGNYRLSVDFAAAGRLLDSMDSSILITCCAVVEDMDPMGSPSLTLERNITLLPFEYVMVFFVSTDIIWIADNRDYR